MQNGGYIHCSSIQEVQAKMSIMPLVAQFLKKHQPEGFQVNKTNYSLGTSN